MDGSERDSGNGPGGRENQPRANQRRWNSPDRQMCRQGKQILGNSTNVHQKQLLKRQGNGKNSSGAHRGPRRHFDCCNRGVGVAQEVYGNKRDSWGASRPPSLPFGHGMDQPSNNVNTFKFIASSRTSPTSSGPPRKSAATPTGIN